MKLNVFIAQLTQNFTDYSTVSLEDFLLISSFADFYYQPAPRLIKHNILRGLFTITIKNYYNAVLHKSNSCLSVTSRCNKAFGNLSLCPIMRQRVEHDSCSSEHGGSDFKKALLMRHVA